MTGRPINPRIVVFRWMSMVGLPVALCLRAFSTRVIFMEPVGRLRSMSWVNRLEAWGLEWIDVHAVPGLRSDAPVNLAGAYASELIARMFSQDDFRRFYALFPTGNTSPAKSRSVLYRALADQIFPLALAYVIAERFRLEGAKAYVCHPHCTADTLVAAAGISLVKNLGPGGLPGFLMWAIASAITMVGRKVRFRIAHLIGALRRTIPVPASRSDDQGDTPLSAPVLFFPHQGIHYSDAYRKDQFYEDDPASPLYMHNICHVELDVPSDTKRKIEESYRREGLKVRFLGPRQRPGTQFVRAAAHSLWSGPVTAANVAKWLIMVGSAISVEGYRHNLKPYTGARLALLGFDFNFPATAVFAMQSLDIRVAATQERYNYLFQEFYAPGLDVYFASGPRIKARLIDNANAAIDTVTVVGDLKAIKISQNRMQALAERKRHLGQFDRVCLVVDYHSSIDPFDNRLLCGPDWESNAFFYQTICDLAERHRNCAFVIRSKESSWQKIPALEAARKRILSLDNVLVDDTDEGVERPYFLTAMADVVIARYSSLCDQCLAEGIPVLVYTELPGVCGGPQLSWLRSYGIVIDTRDDLFSRFYSIIENEPFFQTESLNSLREEVYGRRPNDAPAAPLAILHEHLRVLLDESDPVTSAQSHAAGPAA